MPGINDLYRHFIFYFQKSSKQDVANTATAKGRHDVKIQERLARVHKTTKCQLILIWF